MARYDQYRIQNVNITDILQDSTNRVGRSFSGYRVGNSEMVFANYDSLYHPFNYDTHIENYFNNRTSGVNKLCCAHGYSPILQERYFFQNDNDSNQRDETVNITYVPSGSSLLTDYGILRVTSTKTLQNGTVTSNTTKLRCPHTFILMIQGSGGGGACGGGYWTGSRCWGGGNGPCVVLNIEVPYANSSETSVATIKLGRGGNGGTGGTNFRNSGSDGEISQCTLNTDIGSLMINLSGGKGGLVDNVNNGKGNSSKPWAVRTVTGLNTLINTGFYGGSPGTGRVALNNALKDLYKDYSSIRGYIPGIYASSEAYMFIDYSTGGSYKVAGSTSTNYSSISVMRDSYYGQLGKDIRSTAIFIWPVGANSHIMAGYPSFMGKRGLWADSDGHNGQDGGCGAGGGAGGPATAITDAGIGTGGRGGGAGVKIFW